MKVGYNATLETVRTNEKTLKLQKILFLITILNLPGFKSHCQIDSFSNYTFQRKPYIFQYKVPGLNITKKDSIIYSYDSLTVYISVKHWKSQVPKEKKVVSRRKFIYVDLEGNVVIRAKMKGYRTQHPAHGRIKYLPVGMWRYYDSGGKLITKKRFKFPNKKHRTNA